VNLKIETPDEVLARLPKPVLEPVDSLRVQPTDWLVVCGGFEDRSLAVLRNAIAQEPALNVILIHYRPAVHENKNDRVREICAASANVIALEYDRQNPQGFGTSLVEALSGRRGRVFVDVSAMSRLLIVQILVALGTRPNGFLNCTIAYTEAGEYPPTESEASAELARAESDPTLSILFLSSGVFEITILPELGSIAPAAAQTRLITFPSLDAHHLTALQNEIQPSRLTLIEGLPPFSANQWRRELIAKVNGIARMRDAESYATSTLDYRETLDRLVALYQTHSLSERLIVAPTGSKMQSVAVGIFRSFVSDVQVVYPTPHGYCSPDNYTRGVGQSYSLQLDSLSPERRVMGGELPLAVTGC
jgi:hypothetical protein